MKIEKYYDYKLCYVKKEDDYSSYAILYFTNDMKKQTGDDWDDVPYEHNAEEPYEDETDVISVVVEHGFSELITPNFHYTNSPYCVNDINEGVVPWITIQKDEQQSLFIKAGATLKETIDLIKDNCPYWKIHVQLKED